VVAKLATSFWLRMCKPFLSILGVRNKNASRLVEALEIIEVCAISYWRIQFPSRDGNCILSLFRPQKQALCFHLFATFDWTPTLDGLLNRFSPLELPNLADDVICWKKEFCKPSCFIGYTWAF